MICVSIGNMNIEQCITAIRELEMAEIRIDLLKLDDFSTKQIFSSHKNLIATCREGFHTEEERLELMETAMKAGAKYIDIEIEASDNFRNSLIKVAKQYNTIIIISFHDFKATPSFIELDIIAKDCFKKGASIAKLVSTINSIEDRANIMALYSTNKNIIAFGMGELGKLTRILATEFGAPYSYASYDDASAVAPGQISLNKMKLAFENLKNI